jgi:hypothetical protein
MLSPVAAAVFAAIPDLTIVRFVTHMKLYSGNPRAIFIG